MIAKPGSLVPSHAPFSLMRTPILPTVKSTCSMFPTEMSEMSP